MHLVQLLIWFNFPLQALRGSKHVQDWFLGRRTAPEAKQSSGSSWEKCGATTPDLDEHSPSCFFKLVSSVSQSIFHKSLQDPESSRGRFG
jgi:hypothetical protein